MRVTALQLKNYIGNKDKSFKVAEKYIFEAAKLKSQLVALPELSSCGYIPNENVWNYAEEPNGDTARWACNMAKKYSIYVGAGYLETDGKDFYNAYLLANPAGYISGRVHKSKTEPHCFKPSNIGRVIETDIGRIAIGICADNHVEEFYNELQSLYFDLLLMPHAWATPYKENKYIKQNDIESAEKNVRLLGQIYATCLGKPVVFINPVGEVPVMYGLFGKLTSPKVFRLRGGSALYYPDGKNVRRETEDEGTVTADIVLGQFNNRSESPIFYDGWLHPGSRFCRKILAPIDMALGKRFYDKHKNRIINK